MRNYSRIGIQIADILLPRKGVEMEKWAVIACDQFTSQPEYWIRVAKLVGTAPSTYHLVLPEVYLGTAEETRRVESTQTAMRLYLEQKILQAHEGLVYVERTVDGKTRRGLMLALDLEQYDYNKGSHTLIRATEGTILDRLPPRIRIREGASIEVPHIMVLIDDPQCTVIEPLQACLPEMIPLYDFDLMFESGHLRGALIKDPAIEKQVISALSALADPQNFSQKYGLNPDQGVLLFAVGDGNHSLATAKAIWEKIKYQVGMDHPARYALVEIENVHDQGLSFEPIHRVLFNVEQDLHNSLQKFFGNNFQIQACAGADEMVRLVESQAGADHLIGLVHPGGFGVLRISNSSSNLPVGTLQAFLDHWLIQGGAEKIDYVHGRDIVCHLGLQAGHLGFYLPAMQKGDLFKTVLHDGALPRKTFSMGEAKEKRFYVECRKIVK